MASDYIESIDRLNVNIVKLIAVMERVEAKLITIELNTRKVI